MILSENEVAELSEMLSVCKEKFGDLSLDQSIIYENGCTQCSGSCSGHGMSVWTACDVK